MISKLFRYHGGLKLEGNKELSNQVPIRQAHIPQRLILPTQQHIGAPAEPMVNVGGQVFKGQMIAKAKSPISAPVHAPTSGTVVAIDNYPIAHPSGQSAPCIVIEPDGQDTWAEHHAPVKDYHSLTAEELRSEIQKAGIVGLGGAGFPSYIKLNPGKERAVETLILNAAECEPYITCDDMLMRERADDIISGLQIIKHSLDAHNCIVGIEDDKVEAYEALQAAIKASGTDVEIVKIPTLYPGGGEKQLIKLLTGKEVPANKLPLDIRVVCHNVGTAAAIHRAIFHGEPLTSRIMTITGAVDTPCNLEVLFGTLANDLITECGGHTDDIERIIMGGPMMGFALPRGDVPVIKTTNCLLATNKKVMPLQLPQAMSCIRCGACADACPVNLLPQQLYWHAHSKNFDKIQDFSLFDCIECGCCDYVCPSKIPLVQYFRYAKMEIWTQDEEKRKASIARDRHEFRQLRIEREKEERAARHKKKAAALKSAKENKEEDAKKVAIQAAMERAKAKRAAIEHPEDQKAETQSEDANKENQQANDQQEQAK